MCKKVSLGVIGFMLIAGLLFGGRLIPYAQTAYQKMRDAANDRVPVEFQIDAAKKQLEQIGPQVEDMVHQIAIEKMQIKRLAADVKRQDNMLEKSYAEMMTLRNHLASSDEFYVATNNRKYDRTRVEEDLRHRLSLYKTAVATKEKQQDILRIRNEALQGAFARLEETKAQQRELEVQIENLMARNRMNEVVATSSKLDFDNSELAQTRKMIDDIDAKISAKEEVLNMAPKFYGQIPVSESDAESQLDILQELDALEAAKKSGDKDETFDFNDEI